MELCEYESRKLQQLQQDKFAAPDYAWRDSPSFGEFDEGIDNVLTKSCFLRYN